MAINFLNSINLNQNELIKARIENQPNNASAGTGVEGQLYYDTTADVLKVWAAGAWVEVGGGVITVTSGDTNTITIGGTAANPTVSANTAVVTNGSPNLVTGDSVYDFVIGRGYVESVSGANSTFIDTAISGTAADPIVTASLSATGTPDNTKYLRGDNTWSPVSGIYSFNVSDGTTSSTVLNAQTVTFSGTTNEIEVGQSGRTVTIGLPNDVTIAGALTVSGTGQSSFGGQVTIPTTPVAATDAASKGYVDNVLVGALIFQGGYNASTNTPNLDTPPTGTIKKGFMWTVTADGSFFTEQVRVGDSLIANKDTPTTLADWTTVQANTDLATLTTIGLGNVNPAAGTSGIDVTYSNGTALVENIDKGSSQNIFKNIAVAGQSTVVADNNNDTVTLVAGNSITITTNATTDEITIASSYTPTVTSGAVAVNTSGTYTYQSSIKASATNKVMIQLVDTLTHETVDADITRVSTTQFAVAYGNAPTNGVTALVQLIG